MTKCNKRTRLVNQLIELKNRKLKNGSFTINEQIKHDKIVSQISYLSEKSCRKVAKIMKKINRNKK